MATTIAGVAMGGGSGFVLKSVREGRLETSDTQTFSVQNEGDFCIIASKYGGDSNYNFYISIIDDIPINLETRQSSIVFGKNITVRAGNYKVNCCIYEYGPAE